MINNTLVFVEILEKLPFYRRREVFNFLEFIYQKTIEEDLGGFTAEELQVIEEKRRAYLKKTPTNMTIEEAKHKLKAKYGL